MVSAGMQGMCSHLSLIDLDNAAALPSFHICPIALSV